MAEVRDSSFLCGLVCLVAVPGCLGFKTCDRGRCRLGGRYWVSATEYARMGKARRKSAWGSGWTIAESEAANSFIRDLDCHESWWVFSTIKTMENGQKPCFEVVLLRTC